MDAIAQRLAVKEGFYDHNRDNVESNETKNILRMRKNVCVRDD